MNVQGLSESDRAIRMNIRNFLLTATPKELETEKQLSLDKGDKFRAECIQELIDNP